jgi:Family of unknown function (DUF6502)
LEQSEEQGTALVDVVEAALKALMPLFRNFGVSHHDLSRTLARLYVYDTEEVLKREGHPTTPARLALMTGLTRGETEKYLEERGGDMKRRLHRAGALSAPAVILSVWNSDSRFSTPYQVALDLDLQPTARRRTFRDLVEVAAPGVDPDAILDQLLAAGCVEVHDDMYVRCTSRAYVPAGISVDRITRAGYALIALARTITYNLLEVPTGGETLIERGVVSDFPISPEGRRSIRKWLTEDGTRFLETLDAWLTNSRSELEGPGTEIGVEMFMYEKPKELMTSTEIVSQAQ